MDSFVYCPTRSDNSIPGAATILDVGVDTIQFRIWELNRPVNLLIHKAF
jgi:hypothetical protein